MPTDMRPYAERYTRRMIGNRHHRLVVIGHHREHGETRYVCKCDCGRFIDVGSSNVTTGRTRSCGCLQVESRRATNTATKTKHGLRSKGGNLRLYRAWANMVRRCSNPTDSHYHLYGGRGVTVCDEWANSPRVFADWAMRSGYSELLTLDRIDNNQGYSPWNCRWADRITQAQNKRTTMRVSAFGKQRTLREWTLEPEWGGVSTRTMQSRLRQGWSAEQTVSSGLTPPSTTLAINSLKRWPK